MTVTDITDRHVICDWFEGDDDFRSGFRPNEIENARLVYQRQLAELDRLGACMDVVGA